MSHSRIAVVTGAGSGIGRAVALALIEHNWIVALLGRRLARLEETAAQAGSPGAAAPFVCDVADEASVTNAFEAVAGRFGRIDLLFNNAGTVAPPLPIEELTLAQWRRVVNTNLTGAFLCTQAAVRAMKAQDPQGGRIINNGSISAHAPRPNSAPYTATKHAITGLTRSTALDGRRYDIACGQIDIGNARTEMVAAMSRGVPQPNGELMDEATMDVEAVARSVVYMANLPPDANALFLTVMATKMPFVGRG
jgi:NAD(P)-dependent dehydrogenase (short-subunit alcohol dehydrogenase family)